MDSLRNFLTNVNPFYLVFRFVLGDPHRTSITMPPKRDASKASKATKADDKPAATGRATRAAKKRDQVDLAAEGW